MENLGRLERLHRSYGIDTLVELEVLVATLDHLGVDGDRGCRAIVGRLRLLVERLRVLLQESIKDELVVAAQLFRGSLKVEPLAGVDLPLTLADRAVVLPANLRLQQRHKVHVRAPEGGIVSVAEGDQRVEVALDARLLPHLAYRRHRQVFVQLVVAARKFPHLHRGGLLDDQQHLFGFWIDHQAT